MLISEFLADFPPGRGDPRNPHRQEPTVTDPLAHLYAETGAGDPDADLEKLVFPANSTIAAKEYLVLAKGDLPGQHPFGLGDVGDAVTLLDATLKPISHVTYGPMQAALSYCRLPDGTGDWTVDCIPTFGAANQAP